MELDSSFYTDFITNDPTTGSPVDADSTPTVNIFEEDNDTPILTVNAVKRVSYTGNYRVKIDVITSNGFETGRSYAVVANVVVGGTSGKAIINNFVVTDTMDILLDVARSLSQNEVPESFAFTYAVPVPIEVFSPTVVFSDPLICPFADMFNGYYDTVTKTWKDGSPGTLPLDMKAEVLLQQEAYDNYLSELNDWNIVYNDARWAEYRKHLAQTLIDVCTP